MDATRSVARRRMDMLRADVATALGRWLRELEARLAVGDRCP
ncbi:hypothetical protein [Haloactinopolyspora alba]|nr:hypothetical protein [Haloactinopolyspora alba]